MERRGWVIAFEIGSTGNGRNPIFNGRRQPSCGGTSRMTRECQVRICERLGVKFPGPTRPSRQRLMLRAMVRFRRSRDLAAQRRGEGWGAKDAKSGSNRCGVFQRFSACYSLRHYESSFQAWDVT